MAWKQLWRSRKFKEGGKNNNILTYNGAFGATKKVLAFIEQYDMAFREGDLLDSYCSYAFPKIIFSMVGKPKNPKTSTKNMEGYAERNHEAISCKRFQR